MKKVILSFLILVLTLLTFGCSAFYESQQSSFNLGNSSAKSDLYEPIFSVFKLYHSWQYATPESQNVDTALLAQFHSAIAELDIFSAVTARNGVIIDEYYKSDEYNEDTLFKIASCTKAVCSMLTGIAIEDGLIPSVDVPIIEYYPQIAEYDDPLKEQITIENILTGTSGLAYFDELFGSTAFSDLRRSDDWINYMLNLPMAWTPGSTFSYSTGDYHLVSGVIEEASGMSTAKYAEEKLFLPLGIQTYAWGTGPEGVQDGGTGLALRSTDILKIGQLFLDDGIYKGEQIISSEWIERSTTTFTSGAYGVGSYGYGWWIRNFGASGEYFGYFAMGYAGKHIIVVPDLELVTVFTGTLTSSTVRDVFNRYLVPACD